MVKRPHYFVSYAAYVYFSFEFSVDIIGMRADGLLEHAPKSPYGASFRLSDPRHKS